MCVGLRETLPTVPGCSRIRQLQHSRTSRQYFTHPQTVCQIRISPSIAALALLSRGYVPKWYHGVSADCAWVCLLIVRRCASCLGVDGRGYVF